MWKGLGMKGSVWNSLLWSCFCSTDFQTAPEARASLKMQVLGSTGGLFGDHTLKNLNSGRSPDFLLSCCSRCPLLPGHEFLLVCVSYLASGRGGGDMQVMFCLLPPSGQLFAHCDWGDITQKHPTQLLKHQELAAAHFGFDPFFGSRSDQTWAKISTFSAAQFGDVWILGQCPSILLVQADREQL